MEQHPGGKKILLKNCGKDASDAFWSYHSEKVMEKHGKPLKIGQGAFIAFFQHLCDFMRRGLTILSTITVKEGSKL